MYSLSVNNNGLTNPAFVPAIRDLDGRLWLCKRRTPIDLVRGKHYRIWMRATPEAPPEIYVCQLPPGRDAGALPFAVTDVTTLMTTPTSLRPPEPGPEAAVPTAPPLPLSGPPAPPRPSLLSRAVRRMRRLLTPQGRQDPPLLSS